MPRAEVERRLLDEEDVLERVASLLAQGISIRDWPGEQVAALRRAISEEGLRATEADKAFALRRHLFGSVVPDLPAGSRNPLEGRRAERLRADLPKLVPLRAGLRCRR
jgi:hypothetical protein